MAVAAELLFEEVIQKNIYTPDFIEAQSDSFIENDQRHPQDVATELI